MLGLTTLSYMSNQDILHHVNQLLAFKLLWELNRKVPSVPVSVKLHISRTFLLTAMLKKHDPINGCLNYSRDYDRPLKYCGNLKINFIFSKGVHPGMFVPNLY